MSNKKEKKIKNLLDSYFKWFVVLAYVSLVNKSVLTTRVNPCQGSNKRYACLKEHTLLIRFFT